MGQPDANDPRPPRKRLKRRLLIGFVVVMAVVAAVVVFLPTLLGTGPGLRLLVGVVNGRLAPGKVAVGRASLSWTRPVELGDVVLVDPGGKTVLSAKTVRTDLGLLDLIRSGGDYGTVRVAGAMVDFERRADGSIDVLEALAGLTRPRDPKDRDKPLADPAVVVVVDGGRFLVRSPEFPDGLAAESFRMGVTLARGKPLDVALKLAAEGGRSLDLHAVYDHRAAEGTSPDAWATAVGKDWPLAVASAGLTARGRFSGEVDANRQKGLWASAGAAELRDAVAEGAVLAGDRPSLTRVTVDYSLAESKAGWTVHKFSVDGAVVALSLSGPIPPSASAPTKLRGHADLAALTRMLPHMVPVRDGLSLTRGTARVEGEWATADGADRLQVMATVADLEGLARGRAVALRDPATLSGSIRRVGGKVAIERFSARAAGVDATATGDLDRGIILVGTVDLARAEGQLREWLDLGAVTVAGQARIKADYRHAGALYEARFAAEVAGPSLAGLTSDPIARDHARIEGTLDGPGSPLGYPTGWHKARLAVDGGDSRADLHATADGDALALVVGASIPLASPVASRAEARASFRRTIAAAGLAQEIDELRLSLTPDDPALAPARIALAARGRVDLSAGTLTLTPLAAPEPGVGVALAGEGLSASGINQAGAPIKVRAILAGELGALDRMLGVWGGVAPHGVAGAWSAHLELSRGADGVLGFDGGANVPQLVMTSPRGPVALGLRGDYAPASDFLHLAGLDLATGFGRLVVAGNIAHATGEARGIDLSGTIEPRWEEVDRIVAASVEPNALIRGTGRPFHLQGPVPAGSVSQALKGLEGEIGFDLESARAFGMTLGATPIVLRLGNGRAIFDPIATTLNDGPVAIAADLLVDDPNALWLRVSQGSKVDGAAINEAVSHDILSYIAPVLSESSQVRGKVSLAIDGAVVPLIGPGLTRAEGQARFDQVIFQPGAFATEVFGLTGLAPPRMTLDQTLKILVADGRVTQSGLSIGVGGDAKINIDGSVGLDRTLALRAALPITAGMLGRDERLNQIVAGTRVTIPIGGTLSHPKLDKRAFQVALRDAAKSMVRQGVRQGLGEALDQVIPGAGGAIPSGNRGVRGSVGDDALNLLRGVGRDLLDPKKKP